MTIDWTKPVQTRDGRSVEIITTKGRENQPVLGYVADRTELWSWFSDGHFLSQRTYSLNDIVNVPERRELWLNVYEGGDAECYAVREDADNSRSSYERIACVHVKYKVGEGLE